MCSMKKGVLGNFTKFTGKHLRPAALLKQRLWHRCFPVNFAKFLRTSFVVEHLWWLLLIQSQYILEQKNPPICQKYGKCMLKEK